MIRTVGAPLRICVCLGILGLATCRMPTRSETESRAPEPRSRPNPEIIEAPERPIPGEPGAPEVPGAPGARHRPSTDTEGRDRGLEARERRRVELIMNRMSLDEKIGHRFMTWIPGTRAAETAAGIVRDEAVAGIILESHNIVSRAQVRSLTRELQRLARESRPGLELLVGVDQEGGRVVRFNLAETTRFPAPFHLAAHDDTELMRAAGYVVGREIRDLGCNMNFAPVLDLYATPDSSVIGDRSLGPDPARVGALGTAYMRGAREAGVVPVAKHFPGHGCAPGDTHTELPVVGSHRREEVESGLVPFRMAVEGGAEAIMTAHVIYQHIDPQHPATLSRPVIRGLLRGRLAYDGLVVSDALEMTALREHFGIRETLRLCIHAGVDLILVGGRYEVGRLKAIVLDLLREGEITERDIDEGLRRVLELKTRIGLAAGAGGTPPEYRP